MPYRLILLAVTLVVAGCGDTIAESPRKNRQERAASTEAALNQTPAPRTYHIGDGELKVVDVPVSGVTGFVSTQRCYVWRDLEFRSVTMSCPAAPNGMLVGED